MTRSLNLRGDTSNIWEVSAARNNPLGARMHTPGGRVFRYARASATALSAGRVVQAPFHHPRLRSVAINANVASGVGDYVDLLPSTTGVEQFDLNEFEDGLLLVSDGAGEGHVYVVRASAKFQSADRTMRVYLDSRVATQLLASTTRVSLLKNRFRNVEIAKSATYRTQVVGIAPVAVSASYYFWLATDGPCAVLQQDTLYKELPVSPSEITAGAVTLTRNVVPTGTEYRNVPHAAEGLAVIQTEVYTTDRESLTTTSGLAIVPSVSIGTVLEPAEHGNHCLIQLSLDN